MESAAEPIVIFEPLAGGHRARFVRHLYDHAVRRVPENARYVFYVHASIAEELPAPVPGVEVMAAAPVAGDTLSLRFALYRQLRTVCSTLAPRHIMLMAFGDLEWPLVFWRCPVPLSAILFVQYPELSPGLKRWFKARKTGWILKRNRVRQLFLLNGTAAARKLEAQLPGDTRFLPVPDPLLPLPAGWRVSPPLRWSKTVFLYFGAISRRKGFGLLVDAMLALPPEAHARMKFIICGRPEDPGYFEVMLGRLTRSELPVQLEVVKRFLSEEEMISRFLGADVVLMPYLRPEYSSGVLGIAAQTQRPVIGPKRGLLGRLIRDNQLGMTCAMRPGALKNALCTAVEKGVEMDRAQAADFAARSDPALFAQMILDALTGEAAR